MKKHMIFWHTDVHAKQDALYKGSTCQDRTAKSSHIIAEIGRRCCEAVRSRHHWSKGHAKGRTRHGTFWRLLMWEGWWMCAHMVTYAPVVHRFFVWSFVLGTFSVSSLDNKHLNKSASPCASWCWALRWGIFQTLYTLLATAYQIIFSWVQSFAQ